MSVRDLRLVCEYTTPDGTRHQVVDGTEGNHAYQAIPAYSYARLRIPNSNAKLFKLASVTLGREVLHEEIYPPEEDLDGLKRTES